MSFGSEMEIDVNYTPDKNGEYTLRLYNSEGGYVEQTITITGFKEAHEDGSLFKYDPGDFISNLKKMIPWFILLIIILAIISEIMIDRMKKKNQEANETKIFGTKTMSLPPMEEMDISKPVKKSTKKSDGRKRPSGR